jgi:hypothetical protein
MLADEHIGTLESTVGASDLVGYVRAKTYDELYAFVNGPLREIPGVRTVEAATIVAPMRHDAHLVRLV